MLVIVHGGAAAVPIEFLEAKMEDLRQAAKKGFMALLAASESTAVDAVQASVVHMENSGYFNSGFGSSLTAKGEVEMDAIVADGKQLDFGAVASVTRLRNPVVAARTILDKSEHCLFVGEGAHVFCSQHGLELVEPGTLVNDLAKKRLEQLRTFKNSLNIDILEAEKRKEARKSADDHDTVGSVAIDRQGNVAAATSTGGITGKLPGRVGDSPIYGAGAFADNQLGAASATGHGETIMRTCLTREIFYRNKELNNLQRSVDSSLQMMKERTNGFGGLIAATRDGEIGIGFSTVQMPWAYIHLFQQTRSVEQLAQELQKSGDVKLLIRYGSYPGENFTIDE